MALGDVEEHDDDNQRQEIIKDTAGVVFTGMPLR
jgi:hypothetical protein